MLLERISRLFAALLVCALLLAACRDADESASEAATPTSTAHEPGSDEHEEGAVHWGYEADTGAENWASLSEEFATCEAGVEQSPIDIESADAEGKDISDPVLNWQTSDLEIINNGHTIQANVAAGSTSELDGQIYNLLQFHWHRPSEHTVDGDPFAMELHLVHSNASGNLAVLGVLLEEGTGSPLYNTLWEQQSEVGESNTLTGIDFSGLLPDDLTTYVYAGSLTTPPCSEGVTWNVLESPANISPGQVEGFLYDGNARPAPPVNERTVEIDES